MIRRAALERLEEIADEPDCPEGSPTADFIASEGQCLEQILEAFRDIADRDDIHQAAERLAQVQDWIRRAAERAAADPLFAGLRLAS